MTRHSANPILAEIAPTAVVCLECSPCGSRWTFLASTLAARLGPGTPVSAVTPPSCGKLNCRAVAAVDGPRPRVPMKGERRARG